VLRGQSTRKTATASVQRIDKAPLQKRFQFLGDFERCSWVGGAVQDDSWSSVPSPTEVFIRAYVVLTPAQTKELMDRYEWAQSNGDVIPLPSHPLGEGFPKIQGPFWTSDALNRALPSMTGFGGAVLLQRDGRLLYLSVRSF
jgi:hypothetical protein